MRNRVRNVNSKDFSRMSKDTSGRGKHCSNTSSQLAGITMDSGYGTCATNTPFGSGVSTRGVREGFSPSGPGGRW